MEEKKFYSIKEISKLLNIPKATIRYWDSEGLISPPRNTQNDYREFSLTEAMELSNISFYRNIDIPVKELKQMINSDISVQKELLQEAEERLEQKRARLKQQAERIRMQQQALKEVSRLREARLKEAEPVFVQVAAFSHLKKKHWQKMTENPGAFVLVFEETEEAGFQYGMGYEAGEQPEEEEDFIWERAGQRFIEGLLIADNRDESRNDLAVQRDTLRKQGIQTGRVIAQYLTSGMKGQKDIWDYYKMWMEIK